MRHDLWLTLQQLSGDQAELSADSTSLFKTILA